MSQLVGFLEIEYEGTYATPGNYEIKQGTLSNNVEESIQTLTMS